MADDAASTTDAQKDDTTAKDGDTGKPEQKPAEQQTDADIAAVAAKADNPDAVRNALTAERTAAKEARERADQLAADLKKYQDRDKTEQQKAEDRANTAESEAKDAKQKLLRFTVAADKKLPMDLADRLQGDTKAQLEADADRLLELVKPNSKPQGQADGGKGEGGEGKSFNDQLREEAGYR